MNGVDLAAAAQKIARDCRVLIARALTTEPVLHLPAQRFGSKSVFLSKPIHSSEFLANASGPLKDRSVAMPKESETTEFTNDLKIPLVDDNEEVRTNARDGA